MSALPDTRSGAGAGRVLYRGRPSAWWIVLGRPVSLFVPFLLAVGVKAALESAKLLDAAAWALRLAWALLALALAWRVVEWLSRRYTVTTVDVSVRAGVIQRVGADIPLRNVQHVTLFQGLIERLLGLGSVGMATAGSDGPVAYFVMIRTPREVMDLLRRESEAHQAPPRGSERSAGRLPASRPVVIGLAGGIGAGKSAVAKVFAERGAVVIDSDHEAKEALNRPEVRAELVRWWGDDVLGSDGRIDRKKVAEIIFADRAQRDRLERLVHPLVRANRSEMIARADPRSTPAVVVDAPLLYEVGLDQECDVVVFVESPREQRLARVRGARGWDEAELEKREKSQLPLEDKRRRADHVVVNDASPEALGARAGEVLNVILRAHAADVTNQDRPSRA